MSVPLTAVGTAEGKLISGGEMVTSKEHMSSLGCWGDSQLKIYYEKQYLQAWISVWRWLLTPSVRVKASMLAEGTEPNPEKTMFSFSCSLTRISLQKYGPLPLSQRTLFLRLHRHNREWSRRWFSTIFWWCFHDNEWVLTRPGCESVQYLPPLSLPPAPGMKMCLLLLSLPLWL